MTLHEAAGQLFAALEHMPERRHEDGSERVLYHGRGKEGRDPDQPCLGKTELDAKRKPRKSASKNEDVAEPHRHKKQWHRAIPSTLAQPSRRKGGADKSDEIARC